MKDLFYWVWKANDEEARNEVCPFIFGPRKFQSANPYDAARQGAAAGIVGRVAVLNPFTCEVTVFDASVAVTVGEVVP